MATLLHLRLTPLTEHRLPLNQVARELALGLLDLVHFHVADDATRRLVERLEPDLTAETDDDEGHVSLCLPGPETPRSTFLSHLLAMAAGMERTPLTALVSGQGWSLILPTLGEAAAHAASVGAFALGDELQVLDGPCRCSICALVRGEPERLEPLLMLLERDDTTAAAAEQLLQVLDPSPDLLARLLDRADTAPPLCWYALSRCIEAWLPRLSSEGLAELELAWLGEPGRQATVLPVLAGRPATRSRALAYVIEHLEEGGPRARVAVDIAAALGEQTQTSLLPTLTAMLEDPAHLPLHEPIILCWRRTWGGGLQPPQEVVTALERRAETQDPAGKLAAWAATSWGP